MFKTLRANRDHINLIAEWQVAMALESENMTLDLATVTSGVTKVFDEPSIGFYILCLFEDHPVGCCLVLKEWSDWRNGDVLWIHSVYTVPAYRRKGVFSCIYKFLERDVKSKANLRGLRLYVDKCNSAAHQTYESLGMTSHHYDLYEWMNDR